MPCNSGTPTTVHQFIQDITTADETQPFQESLDQNFGHSQALKTIHMSIPREYLLTDQEMLAPRLPSLKPNVQQPAINMMIYTFPDCVAQGDLGANRALTNARSLLSEFTAITPFPIGTIGPKPILATHKGIMNLPTIEGSYEGFTTYYSKDASDSVISPDRHVSESQG